jgi:hypothetical protein
VISGAAVWWAERVRTRLHLKIQELSAALLREIEQKPAALQKQIEDQRASLLDRNGVRLPRQKRPAAEAMQSYRGTPTGRAPASVEKSAGAGLRTYSSPNPRVGVTGLEHVERPIKSNR